VRAQCRELSADPADDPERIVRAQCRELSADPADDPAALAAELWDLDGWSERCRLLQAALGELVDALEAGDPTALPPGFVVSAAVLRHFQADPLLPPALLAPDWPGPALRADYDRYDAAFKSTWATNFREPPRTPANPPPL
jgi:phenylacetic acid degradation operon negative regulatory protein